MHREFYRMILDCHNLSYDSNGTKICIAAPEYNALYIFMHALKHFFCWGLGIRQICDWTLFLHSLMENNQDPKIIESLNSSLCDMKLHYAWNVFFSFATNWLGLPEMSGTERKNPDNVFVIDESIFPASVSTIWTMILDTGNMGHYKNKFSDLGFIRRKIPKLRQAFLYSRLRRHLSSEIDNYVFYNNIKEYINSYLKLLF